MTTCFEIGSPDDASLALAGVGIGNARLLVRVQHDAHLEAMEANLPILAASGATFVLTGKASTVQRLRQALRRTDVPAARIMTKAYWAPGKVGMD